MEIVFIGSIRNKENVFNDIAKMEQEYFPEYPYTAKEIREFHRRNKGKSIIALHKNKVVAYAIPLLFKNKAYAQILAIAVSKGIQRKGLGKELLKACEESLREEQVGCIISRADVSVPILKLFKSLKYRPMDKEEIGYFVKEGIFSQNDGKVKLAQAPIKGNIRKLFDKGFVMTKDIGKQHRFSFVPMIKWMK